MRNLIITGDDFGASSQVNEEVERLHRGGFLSQASLMVNGPAAEEAVRIAGRNPQLCVGLHLVLCEKAPGWNGMRFFFSSKARRELPARIRSQFARFLELGLPATYWDGHMHLHLHPTVLKMTLPIALESGFNGIRMVREFGGAGPLPPVFLVLSRWAEQKIGSGRMTKSDRTFGLTKTGRIDNAYAREVLDGLPEGRSEFYLHPGAEPEPLEPVSLAIRAREKGIRITTLLDEGGR